MNPTSFRARGIRGATLLAAVLSCAFPRVGVAAVPPPPEAEPANPPQGAPVMLAALPPSVAADPWASQSESPFLLAALPSAELTESEVAPQKPALSPAAAAEAAQRQEEPAWVPPQVRLGGRLSYLRRGDSGDYGSGNEQGVMASLVGHVNAPVWQPWFGSLNGEVDYGVLRSDAEGYGAASGLAASASSTGRLVNGKAQLSLLPLSKFPFEAHAERTDSQSLANLSVLDAYVNQRIGFSQYYQMEGGNVMFGWDNSSQNSDTQINPSTGLPGVEYRQETRKMSLSQNFGQGQVFRLSGNSLRNTLENSGQLSEQRNWVASHSFREDQGFTVDTTADTSRTLSHLQQPGQFLDTDTRQRQFNSLAIWRPANDPLTMNGAVRVMALDNTFGSTGIAPLASSQQMRSANFNVGAAYDLSKNLKLSGSANANLSTSESAQNTVQRTSTAESAGVNYLADSIPVGDYQYLMNGSGSLFNRNGEGSNPGRQFLGSFGHSLNRSFPMGQGAALSSQVSQTASAAWDTAMDESRQLTHSGVLAWNASRDAMTTLLQLNASDARSWGANEGVFQLVNFQATGNWTTSEVSSWSANLTIQRTRSSRSVTLDPNQPAGVIVETSTTSTTTSTGAVSYQNQSVFGVPRLLFNSDLRLNSQALLPTLGGPEDQETAAWENRLEYAIGRVLLRLNVRAAKNGTNMNRSYLFTLTRDFGDI